MAGYALAQVQVRWGNKNLEQFTEAVGVLAELFALHGVHLRHGLITQYGGHLYEVWNLFEVEDAEHMNRARQVLRTEDRYHEVHARLSEVVQSEQIRYLGTLPYSP